MDVVVLTRSLEKDAELAALLDAAAVPHVSVPLVEHAPGPGYDSLADELRRGWSWVAVTSPTAARFLQEAWLRAGRPSLRLAAVGTGTARILERAGMNVVFVPEDAYGSTLARTLPDPGPLLWPASELAGAAFGRELEARGFSVLRLDVYRTRPRELELRERSYLEEAAVAAFASPSAVQAWGVASGARPPVAAIGRVTGRAALDAGFAPAVWPDNPGVRDWARVIQNLYEQKGRPP